jgi:hypothetical protein
MFDSTTIAQAILAQTAARGPGRSICPSEVARALAPEDWRPLMTPVRQAAVTLLREGRLLVLRKGKPVPPEEVRGVIRLATPGEAPA